MLEHDGALGMLQVLVQAHARPALAQDAGQRRLAHLDRLSAQVVAVQLQQVEGVEERLRLVPPVTEQLEEATPLSSQHTTSPSIRQDRTLRWFTASTTSGIALRPVVAPAGDQPDAHGVAPGHEPEAVVLDLVNPVGAGRRLVGGGREAGFDEARPVGGQALTHTLDQHAANLGGRCEESNRNEIPARRIDRVAHRASQ